MNAPEQWFDVSRPATSRRSILGGLIGGTGIALAAGTARRSSASDLSAHPIVGAWLLRIPQGEGQPPAINVQVFHGDGTVAVMTTISQADQTGAVFVSPWLGNWEATGARAYAFTGVQLLSDAAGQFSGTVTLTGSGIVSADGESIDPDPAGPATVLTLRDTTGVVMTETGGDGSFPPIEATRIRVERGAGFRQPPATSAS
jgi:hypothetical protein